MNEIKMISSDDPTENASSAANFEQEFRHTLKHGNKIQICRVLLQDFFTECSVQGFKYFYERKRHWSERVFWMIMFVVATSLSCYMIHDSYIKWHQAPVIVSFSEKTTPVWKIPFPAVTICPEVKISAKMINVTKTFHEFILNPRLLKNVSEEKMNKLIALSHICDKETFKIFGIGKNFTDSILIQTIYEMAIKLKDSLNDCEWRKITKCSSLFRPILTEDGICFTFNSLNSRDIYSEDIAPDLLSVTGNPNATHWNMEQGYTDKGGKKSSLKSYPHRVLTTGAENGLSLALYLDKDDLDYLCQGPVQGFKVVLHAPSEIPQPSKHFFRVPLQQEVLVSVKPNVLETSKELQNYPTSRKLCIMNSENPLKFFKNYTQSLCELECISNHTKKECGCVYFSYPRDEDTPICGVTKLGCVYEIEGKIEEQIFLDSLNDADTTCHCLPSCTSIHYDIEISSAKYDSDKYARAYMEVARYHGLGRLNIYFKEKHFITSKRSELYGLPEFLAAMGGILGLFIGVTALSFVEIIYYFTLRLVWTLRMYRYGKSNDFSKNLNTSPTIKSSKE